MSAIVQRFIHEDLSLEQGWDLIEWCLERGGNEFSLQLMSLDGELPSSHERLKSALAPFHRGTPKRENVTTKAGRASRPSTGIWSLCSDSVAALRHHVANGLFTAPSYVTTGWFENFTIYRHGEIMLGVVSHEGLVVLHLAGRELSELKIESHETAP
jgi:hypothetical protein